MAVIGNSGSSIRRFSFVLMSSTVFALNHWPQGGFKVIATAYLGAIAAVLFLKLRNLWYLIAGHLALNLVSL
jgi:membrane protease YdiL (CAAX protease family)